ncbi:MAG: hypothetical protein WKF57_06525 [Nakamurella sp.]
MNVVFGNLTVAQFAEQVGAEFTAAELAELESHRTDFARSGDPGTFHIFDNPAVQVHIGAAAMADTRHIWEAANNRALFNRPVSFFPLAETPAP